MPSDPPPLDKYHDCRVFNYFKRILRPISFAAFPYRSWNRICDILENISGVGCRIEKQSKENTHWLLVVDTPTVDGYPALFTVKREGGTNFIWMPTSSGSGTGEYVFVNGKKDGVTTTETGSSTGWVDIGDASTREVYLKAKFSILSATSQNPAHVETTWSLSNSSNHQDDEVCVCLAVIVDGTVFQFHVGAVFLTIGESKVSERYYKVEYDGTNKALLGYKARQSFSNGIMIKDDLDKEKRDADILLLFSTCDCADGGTSSSGA